MAKGAAGRNKKQQKTDNWPTRRELVKIVQQQDELIGQQNVELARLRKEKADDESGMR